MPRGRLARLQSLIELVLARAGPGRGYVHLHPRDVNRLRKSIDDVIGPPAGMTLIETGSSEEYRLTINDLAEVQLAHGRK